MLYKENLFSVHRLLHVRVAVKILYFMVLPLCSAYWIWNKPLEGETGAYNGENDSAGPNQPLRWVGLFIIYIAFSTSVCHELYFDFGKVVKCKRVIWIRRRWGRYYIPVFMVSACVVRRRFVLVLGQGACGNIHF